MDIVIDFGSLSIKIGTIIVTKTKEFQYNIPFLREVHQSMGEHMFHLKLVTFVDLGNTSMFIFNIKHKIEAFLILELTKRNLLKGSFNYFIEKNLDNAFSMIEEVSEERDDINEKRFYYNATTEKEKYPKH